MLTTGQIAYVGKMSYTIKQLAEEFNVSVRTIKYWKAAKKIESPDIWGPRPVWLNKPKILKGRLNAKDREKPNYRR